MVGRVVNTLGFPIDGKGPIGGVIRNAFGKKSSRSYLPSTSMNQLQTGIKAVDAMIPVGRGQRELVMVTVKQVNQLFVLTLNQKILRCRKPVFCIYVAIGQKRQL
jgi:F-type H+-transporting ATPase subunit alpha